MSKISKILFLLMFLNWLTSCNIDFKEAIQVSLNIGEAKEKKVFVREYSISNIQSLETNYTFPIKSVWEEKAWKLTLDKNKKETYKVVDSSSNNLVFELNDKDTLLTENNFTNGKWIMWMSDNLENSVGSTRGMINFSLQNKELKDTTSIIIYRQQEPNDHKNNLTPLFRFDIVRQ